MYESIPHTHTSYVSYNVYFMVVCVLEKSEFSTYSINVEIGQLSIKAVWGLRRSQVWTTDPDSLHTFKLGVYLGNFINVGVPWWTKRELHLARGHFPDSTVHVFY